MKWEIIGKTKSDKLTLNEIVDVLLENRGLLSEKAKRNFFSPPDPHTLTLKDLKISDIQMDKAIKRIKTAFDEKQKVLIYGDYDADGICSTGIMWECLFALGLNVTPFIPDRFSDGYGLNSEVIKRLVVADPDLKLIITVDNGIVAHDALKTAKQLGIDVVVTDHHLPNETNPECFSLIHTTLTSGAGVAWIMAREIAKEFSKTIPDSLDLVAIGVVADQMPLVGVNRSFASSGIAALKKTSRPGLRCLYDLASISPQDISTYHINYVIAPRINAMGRIKHGIDSLRFLCTKDRERARNLAKLIGDTNEERQKIVEQVVNDARKSLQEAPKNGVILLASEHYHEGVIGLAAARIVEEFYRPTIVFSVGETHSKASARSISGFNIIESLRQLSDVWDEGGGHAMAAGFTLQTSKIAEFGEKLNNLVASLLTDDLLEKKLKIDLEIGFDQLTWELAEKLKAFEPNGIGNPNVIFATSDVEVGDIKPIGGGKHLKIKFKKEKVFDAIFFGAAEKVSLEVGQKVSIAYSLEINEWNGNKSLQLKVKDLLSIPR